jgi:hypothetical protein
MRDEEIRARLREAFRTFALPRALPFSAAGEEVIVFGSGRNHPCSVGGEIIPETAEDSFEFRYPDGRVVVLHDR